MKFSLLSILLTASSNNNWMWHLLPYLFGAFAVYMIITYIYNRIYESTREKFENEDKKEKYLLKRASNEGFAAQNNLDEEEMFIEFVVSPPYSSKNPWIVRMKTEKPDYGGFAPTGSMKYVTKEVLSISDDELNDLIK